MRVGITGHRGLTGALAEDVRELLRRTAADYFPAELTAITCLADGPDTRWADEVLRHGGRIEAVIPAQDYRTGLPGWHHADYDRLLGLASELHETGLVASTSEAHMAGSEIPVGLSDEILAVLDGLPARGFGGTADVVAYARRLAVPVCILWPTGAVRPATA